MINLLPLVQPPPKQAHQRHLNHLSPSHHWPPSKSSPVVISILISAIVSTANFSTSAVTKVAAAPIPVPSTLKESKNVPLCLFHLSPSTVACIPNLGQEIMNHPDRQFLLDLVHDPKFGCRNLLSFSQMQVLRCS